MGVLKNKKVWLAILLGLVVAVVATMILSAISAKKAEKNLYAERQKLLTITTESAASIIEQTVAQTWEMYGVLSATMSHMLSETPEIAECIKAVNKTFRLKGDYYFFVDERGKYYCSDGMKGKITDLTVFNKSANSKTVSLFTLPHMEQDKSFLIYRGKLRNPITAHTAFGNVTLVYFAYAQDISNIRTVFEDLLTDDFNMFIFDLDGTMLYRDFGIKLLIDGYNVFPKFSKCKRVFGEDPEALIKATRDRKPVAVKLDINKECFYYTSAPLKLPGWSVAFILSEGAVEVK